MLNFAYVSAATATSDDIQPFELAPRPPVPHPARRYGGFFTQIAARTDGVQCKAEYMNIMYKEEVVAGFVQSICRLLERGSREPTRRLSDLLAD